MDDESRIRDLFFDTFATQEISPKEVKDNLYKPSHKMPFPIKRESQNNSTILLPKLKEKPEASSIDIKFCLIVVQKQYFFLKPKKKIDSKNNFTTPMNSTFT